MGNQSTFTNKLFQKQDSRPQIIRESLDIEINNSLIKIIRFKFTDQSHCVSHEQLHRKYIVTRHWVNDELKLWRIDTGYLNMSYIVKPSGVHCTFSYRAYNTSLGIISSSEKFQLITHIKNKMIRKMQKNTLRDVLTCAKVGLIYLDDYKLSFWHLETGQLINNLLSSGDFQCMTYSNINDELAIKKNVKISVINLLQGKIVKSIKTDDDDFFNMILYSPNGKYILALTNNILVVLNSNHLKELWEVRNQFIDCKYSDNSELILCTTKDKIFIYETIKGTLLKTIRISSFSKCNELSDKQQLFIMFEQKLR